MKTENRNIQTFLVLVPHRDARIELQKHSDLLIKSGLTGVYNFPYIAPLASLSRALNSEELKQIAHALRESVGNNKISAEKIEVTAFPDYKKKLTLTGPRLDIAIPQNVFDGVSKKIDALFSPIIAGCFLIPEFISDLREDNKKLNFLRETPFEKLGFRAAAAANMYWRTLKVNGEIYYKWKIGKLCWLPRPKKVYKN